MMVSTESAANLMRFRKQELVERVIALQRQIDHLGRADSSFARPERLRAEALLQTAKQGAESLAQAKLEFAEVQRELLERFPTAIVISAVDSGTVLFENDPARTDYNLEPGMGPIGEYYRHADDRQAFVELLNKHGHVNDIECQFRRRDGGYDWILLSGRLITYQDQRAVLGQASIINHRKQAEELLKQAKEDAEAVAEAKSAFAELQRNLLEASLVPTVVSALDTGEVLFANHLARTEHGVELGTRPITDAYKNPDDRRRLMELLCLHGRVEDFETQIRGPKGTYDWVQLSVHLIDYEDRPASRGAATIINARKEAEELLRRAKDEAEATAQMKSEFVAIVSHEVRTPMNGVLGMARLLRDTELTAEQREYNNTVIRSGESLLRIVDDLLDVSKLEAGKLELEELPFAVEVVIEHSVGILSSQVEEKRLDLRSRIAADVPQVLIGDPYRLEQILLNLVSNAIKFTKQGGVEVDAALSVEREGSATIAFAVSDTGQGIKPENREKLFSDFTQESVEVARKYGGSGLGLAICRRLVALMGGEISLESEVGQGSTFRFTITCPIDRHTAIADLRESSDAEQTLSHLAIPDRRLHVLQVEDNEVNRAVVEKILTTAGHEVINTTNGIEALAALDVEHFDIILMDRHMPEMNGLDTTVRIRARRDDKSLLPIVSITASAIQSESCLSVTLCLWGCMFSICSV